MILINKTLYIEFADFIAAGWTINTLKIANYRNGSFWQMIPNPQDARAVLVEFETLRPKHKEKLVSHFGNPYEYISKAPIKQLITTDHKAQEHYINYRYADNKTLPVEHISKYTAAASWLNMLIKVTADSTSIKNVIKQELHLTVDRFYQNVIDIIKGEDLPLPKTYSHLLRKIKEYKVDGYDCLIDWRFGNTQAKKVNDEIAEALLLELIAHPNQYDDVLVAWKYNEWARANNRDTITDQTVGNYRRKNNHIIISQREGRAAFNDQYIVKAKRDRPTQPLFLCEHDDYHLNYFYVDIEEPVSGKKHYKKYKAIVVTDSFNDLVLGYAYARTMSADLIKKAYLNAMYYIKELTGAWYLPHETKSDRFGSAELQPFYQSMGNYYNTPVGSKGRGYIEQFFGTAHFKRCEKLGATNYTGNNITAAREGVNKEMLELNKKFRPSVDEAHIQIENLFHRLRHMPPGEGELSKQQEWLNAWAAIPEADKKPISDEAFLLIFGTVANEKGTPITITNRGVEPQINGNQYSYDLPMQVISQYIGMKVRVIYDPKNMSRVMLTNFKDFRCIATTTKYLASNMADYKAGHRTALNDILDKKLMQVDYSTSRETSRKKILEDNDIQVEGILQAGPYMPKLIKQEAEEMTAAVYINQKEMSTKHQQYLDEKTDFDKYLND